MRNQINNIPGSLAFGELSLSAALLVVLFLFATALPAKASEVLNPPVKVESKKKSKKADGGSKVKFDSGSAETKKERSARLTRECKGQVNAGACSGYTR